MPITKPTEPPADSPTRRLRDALEERAAAHERMAAQYRWLSRVLLGNSYPHDTRAAPPPDRPAHCDA